MGRVRARLATTPEVGKGEIVYPGGGKRLRERRLVELRKAAGARKAAHVHNHRNRSTLKQRDKFIDRTGRVADRPHRKIIV